MKIFDFFKKKPKLKATHIFMDYAPVAIGKRWFVNDHGSLFIECTKIYNNGYTHTEFLYADWLNEINDCGK